MKTYKRAFGLHGFTVSKHISFEGWCEASAARTSSTPLHCRAARNVQFTLDAIRKLTLALNVSVDMLLSRKT